MQIESIVSSENSFLETFSLFQRVHRLLQWGLATQKMGEANELTIGDDAVITLVIKGIISHKRRRQQNPIFLYTQVE